MSDLVLLLTPLAIGAALQPPQIIAVLVLLQTKRGKVNGFAYVGGMTLFHIVLGAIFWFITTGVESSVESDGGQFNLVVGSIMALLGLLLLIHALRRVFSAKGKDEAAGDWLLRVQSLLLIPLLITIVFPQHAHKWLGVLNAWMERHVRAIKITVTFLLGIFLLYIGLEYLGLF